MFLQDSKKSKSVRRRFVKIEIKRCFGKNVFSSIYIQFYVP